MSRWLRVTIAGLVLSIALGAGATVAVLAATSGGDDEDRSLAPAPALAEEEDERPWLGVIVSRFGGEGVIVQQVFADSPAHTAGVERGDIIQAFEGMDVRSIEDLVAGLEDREVGDEVTLTLLRDDEEISLQVTLGARPEPLELPEAAGPFAELGELQFGDILDGQLRIKDDEGNTVVIEVVAGEVESISEDQLTVAANDGSQRTFSITDDTAMPDGLEGGDPVVVVTVGESDEARLVLSGKAFGLLDTLGRLRERIGERLMPPEPPWPDIPGLEERWSDLIPEWHLYLGPECDPELVPIPEDAN